MKVLSYILSVIWAVVFGSLLAIFHVFQWLALKLFGYQAHKKVVDVLNFLLIKSLLLLGVTVRYEGKEKYPKDRNVIFVSNHQSMFDIPPMIWYFRKMHPKFVAKKELGKGIPSISFNLKHGGAVLIDRKDKEGALQILKKFGQTIREKKWSAIIFPEGTRSGNQDQKKFSFGGLRAIMEQNPKALIVPVTIKNSWKLSKYGKFPMGLGTRIVMKTHAAMEKGSESFEEFFNKLEEVIRSNGQQPATV